MLSETDLSISEIKVNLRGWYHRRREIDDWSQWIYPVLPTDCPFGPLSAFLGGMKPSLLLSMQSERGVLTFHLLPQDYILLDWVKGVIELSPSGSTLLKEPDSPSQYNRSFSSSVLLLLSEPLTDTLVMSTYAST
jgi:hypothetical protein